MSGTLTDRFTRLKVFWEHATDKQRIGLLVAAVWFAYAPALMFPYVHDDFVLILGEAGAARPDGLDAAGGIANLYWRPLMDGINRLVYAFGGGAPFAFHALNLILHALNTVLVYRWWRLWLPVRWAFWSAFVFACHPLQVESVAAIAGLSNLLMFCFGWTACRFVHRSLEVTDPRQGVVYQCASGCGLLAALLVKEQALVWPAALAVQGFLCPALRMRIRRRPWTAFGTLMWWAGALAVWASCHPAGSVPFQFHAPFGGSLETALRVTMWPVVVGLFWRLFIWPIDGHYFRSVDIASLPWKEAAGWLFPLAVWGMAVSGAVRAKRSVAWVVVFGIVWLTLWTAAICAVPLFIEGTRFAVFDHFIYPALAGAGPLAVVFFSALRSLWKRAGASVYGLAGIWGGCFIIVLSSWRGDIPLFERAVRFEPRSARVWQNLAAGYMRSGRLPEAIRAYQTAGRRYVALMNRARLSAARSWYRRQAAVMAAIAGQTAFARGDRRLAVLSLKRAVSLEPDPRFYNLLGLIAADQGDWPAAVEAFERAAQHEPLSDYTVNWAAALAAAGRLEESREILENLIEQRPDLDTARANLLRVKERLNRRSFPVGASKESGDRSFGVEP